MTVYTPISYCAELKLAFKGKLAWKVADTLHYAVRYCSKITVEVVSNFSGIINYFLLL